MKNLFTGLAWGTFLFLVAGMITPAAAEAAVEDDKIARDQNTEPSDLFGPQQVITTSVDAAGSVFAADLDGDGDLDVLSASWEDGKIAWYENLLPPSPVRVISPNDGEVWAEDSFVSIG